MTGQDETESAIFQRISNHSHANRNMKGYEKVVVVPIRKAKSKGPFTRSIFVAIF